MVTAQKHSGNRGVSDVDQQKVYIVLGGFINVLERSVFR